MGQGSFDKERSSKPGRVFGGTRALKKKGTTFVGNASFNRHQVETRRREIEKNAAQRILDKK